ncbi:MAG: histidine phosphatase family protein [Butyrivibrio sp.]|nr:histidine phosphatase family protein [Butyrivibrio sp.]
MKLIFIRHGDPDYVHDNLTDKGKVEATLLSEDIERYKIDDIYLSPLGRAQATAKYSMDKLGKSGKTYDWLMEFPAQFDPNLSETARMAYENELVLNKETGKYEKRIVWDLLPAYYNEHPELLDRVAWRESEIAKASDAASKYDYVVESFDKLLAEYGYARDGLIYKTEKGNDKTIAFFCHYGITSVLLSHLWNISPFVMFQSMATAPTSVTMVATEERQKGIVSFRTLRCGDVTHLNIGNEEPSFSARFCERYENDWERH